MTLGTILVLIGLSMAWSGFSAKWKMEHFVELRARGIEVKEYGYHVFFRQIWWIPTGIGVLLLIFF
jgi:hypothetical protein